MSVTAPEKTRTDERLDDLIKTVNGGFAKVDADIRELRGEMKGEFKEVDKKMDAGFALANKKMGEGFAQANKKMDAGFAKVDADIREIRSGMNRLMWGLLAAAASIIAALISSNVL